MTDVTKISAEEVEEVFAYAALVQESDEVNFLEEGFNKSASLDPESSKVTAGRLVDISFMETKEGSVEENSSLGGAEAASAAGPGEVSSSGSSEIGFYPVQEPRISNQVSVETTGQTAIIGEHRHVNGMDEHADQQRWAQDDYVWYACYASNLLLARFMCYIKGGQVVGMGKDCIGSRNQTPPVTSRWVMVPYHMFFGHSWTRTWQSGGVAFLDPVSHGCAPTTHVRLYKITLQQFQDILVQENGGDPHSSNFLLEWDNINKLRDVRSASSHATLDILKAKGPLGDRQVLITRDHEFSQAWSLLPRKKIYSNEEWYGAIKYLGEEDGLPMLTVTCPVEHMQRFRKGQFQVCRPSESYVRVILEGLLEQKTLSEEECKAYIASKSKGLPEDGNGERIEKSLITALPKIKLASTEVDI